MSKRGEIVVKSVIGIAFLTSLALTSSFLFKPPEPDQTNNIDTVQTIQSVVVNHVFIDSSLPLTNFITGWEQLSNRGPYNGTNIYYPGDRVTYLGIPYSTKDGSSFNRIWIKGTKVEGT